MEHAITYVGLDVHKDRAALDKVGFRHVAFDRSRIVLGRRGMGLTLNDIAQGYATDRVVALLRAEGIERSLVDMGESRAVGSREEGVPWRIGITDPDAPGRVTEILELVDNAVATSGAYGFRFTQRVVAIICWTRRAAGRPVSIRA